MILLLSSRLLSKDPRDHDKKYAGSQAFGDEQLENADEDGEDDSDDDDGGDPSDAEEGEEDADNNAI